MRPSLRLSGIASTLVLVVLASGCGGGGSKTTQPASTASSTSSPAAARQQIRQNWTSFFSGDTSAAQKVVLLQNGSEFSSAIQAQASSTLAKRTKAQVVSVTLTSPSRATVVYTILLGGQPVLVNRKGTAVLVDGAWKVGDRSFCQLLGLQAQVPPACSSG